MPVNARIFRNKPIRRKLLIMIMIATASALALAGAGIVVFDSLLFRSYLRRDLTALARIIADNSTGALTFGDLKAATETLTTLRARPHVASACVFGKDGILFAHYSRHNATVCPAPGAGEDIRFTTSDVVVTQPILLSGGTVGTLVLVYDLDEIGERTQLFGGIVAAVLLASSLLALLLASKVRGVIEKPISTLVRAASSVSDTGDYSIRAQKISNDELGLLADRFNEMLAGIQSRDEDLKAERERFRFMAESMPQKIFTAKPDGTVDYFNRQWTDVIGSSFEESGGWSWTQFVHPDDVEETVRLWQHSVATGELLNLEHRFRRTDGKYRWHLTSAHSMHDLNGHITMWIGSNTDIHEQKEKEDALRRANEDLQQFAYSASHDLQEPIRNVAVYSEIVARHYGARLDDDGRQFLGFLHEGGRRLATLVDDLLAYTRAGAAEPTDSPVDSLEALRNSITSLSEAIRESGAEVTWDELPDVFIGTSHLQQVFQNLIGNALKYRHDKAPRIHIAAEPQGKFCRFSVQDNGIGIDPQYKEKIFGVFKRLHHDRTYGGTGIGLAICQRVVERYGGRIWVESQPGKGSTFYFTVPRRTGTGAGAPLGSAAG